MLYKHQIRHPCLLLTLVIGLTSCSSISTSTDDEIKELLRERGLSADFGIPYTKHRNIQDEELDQRPLTVEDAVNHALKHNERIRASRAGIGFSIADLYDAQRVRNPLLSAALLRPEASGMDDQLSLSLSASISDLVTLQARKKLATKQYAVATNAFAADVFMVVADVEIAFYDYVAAKQSVAISKQSLDIARSRLELTNRFFKAGNLSKKEVALEKLEAAAAELKHLKLVELAYQHRHHLANLIGKKSSANWETVDTFFLPPPDQYSADVLVDLALASRMDLSAALLRAEYLAEQLKVTDWSRWLQDLELGYEIEREAQDEESAGPHVELSIPIFNTGRGKQLRLAADLEIQAAALQTLSLSVRNDVLVSHLQANNLRQQALVYKDQLIPASKQATQQYQYEQNFMLTGVFDLIESKQREYALIEKYIQTLKHYWQSRARLIQHVGNRLPSNQGLALEAVAVDELIFPFRQNEPHHRHDGSSAQPSPQHRHH